MTCGELAAKLAKCEPEAAVILAVYTGVRDNNIEMSCHLSNAYGGDEGLPLMLHGETSGLVILEGITEGNESAVCECGGLLAYTGEVRTANPPRHVWACRKCGMAGDIAEQEYPPRFVKRIEVETGRMYPDVTNDAPKWNGETSLIRGERGTS